MATVELIPARDQDGTELWQHEECSGVQPVTRVCHPDSMGEGTPDEEHPCPMCGTPGPWVALFRPATAKESAALTREHDRLERAMRRALFALREVEK